MSERPLVSQMEMESKATESLPLKPNELCALASVKTCVNYLCSRDVFEKIDDSSLVKTIIAANGNNRPILKTERERSVWEGWGPNKSWNSLSDKGELRYQAVAAVALADPEIKIAEVVEKMPPEFLKSFLEKCGVAAVSVSNDFCVEISGTAEKGKLQPSGHMVCCLGISHGKVKIFDPYSSEDNKKIIEVNFNQLTEYLTRRDNSGKGLVGGVLISKQGESLDKKTMEYLAKNAIVDRHLTIEVRKKLINGKEFAPESVAKPICQITELSDVIAAVSMSGENMATTYASDSGQILERQNKFLEQAGLRVDEDDVVILTEGNGIVEIDDEFDDLKEGVKAAGIFTKSNRVIGIKPADCGGIIIKAGEWVGIVHASRVQIANGVLTQAIEFLKSKGVKSSEISIVVPPMIGPDHYVFPDLKNTGNEKFWEKLSQKVDGGYALDLVGAIVSQLNGIKNENVFISSQDAYSLAESGQFCSKKYCDEELGKRQRRGYVVAQKR